MKFCLLSFFLLINFNLKVSGQFVHFFNYAPSESAFCVRETSDSCYLVAIGGGSSPDKAIILKLNSTGNIIWQHIDQSVVGSADYVFENSNSDYTFLEEQSIIQSPNIVLKRYTKTGALIWHKDSLVPWNSNGGSLIEDTDSNLIIVGTVTHPSQRQKVLLIKCTHSGDTIFTKEYSDSLNIQGVSIVRAIDTSGYILVCFKYSPSNSRIQSTIIIKVNPFGNEVWRKEYVQSRYYGPEGIRIIDSTSYGICFNSYDSINNKYTPKLSKINLLGDTISTHSYPSTASYFVTSLYYDTSIGYTLLTLIPASGTQLLFTDLNGVLYCSQLVTDPIYKLLPYSMVKNHEGGFAICGGALNTAQSIFDSFVAVVDSLCITTLSINALSSNNGTINIFPNPFNSYISINIKKQSHRQIVIIIRNAFGQTILKQEENNLNDNYLHKIDMNLLSEGLYLLEVIVDGKRTIKKIVKE